VSAFFFCISHITEISHVTIFHFAVALLKAFELGPALFRSSEEATLSQPFSHSTIYLAVSGTSLKCFIKARLFENCKKSLSFLITPMHACYFSSSRPHCCCSLHVFPAFLAGI
uniref:Uncharacterized protein n=1 Tax=Bos mutus grunniens TaxID=30521 RepID=A0A8B9Y1Z2_BOSMU